MLVAFLIKNYEILLYVTFIIEVQLNFKKQKKLQLLVKFKANREIVSSKSLMHITLNLALVLIFFKKVIVCASLWFFCVKNEIIS